MNIIISPLLNVIFHFLSCLNVQACSCADYKLDISHYNRTNSIFTGKLVEIKEREKAGRRILKFEVSKSYKGKHGEYVIIDAPRHPASCGLIGLNIGGDWLIYAAGKKRKKYTNRCSLSKKSTDDDYSNDTALLNTIYKNRNGYYQSSVGEGKLLDGKPEGLWKYVEYNYKHKNVYSTIHYRQGLPHGTWTTYDPKGNILGETFYNRGREIGRKSYNNAGKITFEVRYNRSEKREKFKRQNFDDGTPHKIWIKKYSFTPEVYKEYYPNGQLKKTGKFRYGSYWGKWEYYSEDGELIKKEKPQ